MSKGELVCLSLSALVVGGCGSPPSAPPPKAPAAPVETMAMTQPAVKGIVKNGVYVNKQGVPLCPVSGTAVPNGKEVGKAVYKGVEYHFCCAGCPDEFHANPAKYALK